MRLDAELSASINRSTSILTPPLFSHDATLQLCFVNAWHRVSQCEINRHLGLAVTPQGTDLISKVRSLRACHFHS